MPLPVKLADCGLPCALEVTVIAPVLVPVAVGKKLTLIVHAAPAARLVPQLLLSRKSPLGTMLEIVKIAPPVLLSIMVCG
jgi:hypothetical protein